MLSRSHVRPFLTDGDGELDVEFLRPDADGRVIAFLDRLCRLARRLEGRARSDVVEALRRQERRVRDARRLDGIAKSLLDACAFRPPAGADRSPEVRDALFRARGESWPPAPGDVRVPYERAAAVLDISPDEVDRLLYADSPDRRVLTRAPRFDGATLLTRYNLDLARAVLLDATRVVVRADGEWGDIFRSIKLARLMYEIEPDGDGHRVELTGPAAPYVARSRRYGIRFARVVPALARAPGWRLDAEITGDDGRTRRYRLDARSPVTPTVGRGTRYDSGWERALADEFAEKLGAERDGWSLAREQAPIRVGADLFLPDFTLRHEDGRAALVEIAGFWTPEYLEAKLAKIAAAGIRNLVLVVYRGLAAGDERVADRIAAAGGAGEVLWFANRPRIAPVMEAADRVAC